MICLGVWLLGTSGPWPIALASFVVAAILFKGCPMCWMMGLLDAVARHRARKGPTPRRIDRA
jgi:hypothetical protein